MKKKLLFSLLLGSAFAWMNEMYAAEAATAPAGEAKPADKPAGDSAQKEEQEKEYDAINTEGATIKVKFFDKAKHPGMITKKLNFQDGGTYSGNPNGKQNVPYMAGVPMPEGAAVVYVLRKGDEIILAPADADISGAKYAGAGFTGDPKEFWMYKDENNYLYPYKELPDPNGEFILGKKASIYEYEVPDYEATKLAKDLEDAKKQLADAEEKLKSGGGASSEEVEQLRAELAKAKEAASQSGGGSAPTPAADPSAPATGSFEFKGKRFVVLSSAHEAKEHPELFTQLLRSVQELFSRQPRVATAILAGMLKKNDSVEGLQGGFEKTLVSDIYQKAGMEQKITMVAELQFSTEISFEDAWKYVEGLKEEHAREDAAKQEELAKQPVPAEEVARLQAEHEEALKQKEVQLAEALAAAKKSAEEAQANAEHAQQAEEKAEKALDAAVTVAAQGIQAADTEAAQKEQLKSVAVATLTEAEQEKQRLQQEASRVMSEADAERERLAEEQAKAQQALAEMQSSLMASEVAKAHLEAKATAAETIAKKMEEQLDESHSALVGLASSTATDGQAVVTQPVVDTSTVPASVSTDVNAGAPIVSTLTDVNTVAGAPQPTTAPVVTDASVVPTTAPTGQQPGELKEVAPTVVPTTEGTAAPLTVAQVVTDASAVPTTAPTGQQSGELNTAASTVVSTTDTTAAPLTVAPVVTDASVVPTTAPSGQQPGELKEVAPTVVPTTEGTAAPLTVAPVVTDASAVPTTAPTGQQPGELNTAASTAVSTSVEAKTPVITAPELTKTQSAPVLNSLTTAASTIAEPPVLNSKVGSDKHAEEAGKSILSAGQIPTGTTAASAA